MSRAAPKGAQAHFSRTSARAESGCFLTISSHGLWTFQDQAQPFALSVYRSDCTRYALWVFGCCGFNQRSMPIAWSRRPAKLNRSESPCPFRARFGERCCAKAPARVAQGRLALLSVPFNDAAVSNAGHPDISRWPVFLCIMKPLV